MQTGPGFNTGPEGFSLTLLSVACRHGPNPNQDGQHYYTERGRWTTDRTARPAVLSLLRSLIVSEEYTTAAVQRYLDALAGDQPDEPVVRALLDNLVRRLRK